MYFVMQIQYNNNALINKTKSARCQALSILYECLLLQSPVLQHRVDVRVRTAEVAEHLAKFYGVATAQYHVSEALSVFAGHAAMLFEPGKRIVVQHLRPQVSVVAC